MHPVGSYCTGKHVIRLKIKGKGNAEIYFRIVKC